MKESALHLLIGDQQQNFSAFKSQAFLSSSSRAKEDFCCQKEQSAASSAQIPAPAFSGPEADGTS